MGEENSGAFKCVKISLIVLYVISIIAVVVFIAIAIFGLAVLGSTNADPDHKLTPKQKEDASMKSIIFKIDLKIK
jgi:flagellar basal body-associated protein FliL